MFECYFNCKFKWPFTKEDIWESIYEELLTAPPFYITTGMLQQRTPFQIYSLRNADSANNAVHVQVTITK